MFRTIGAVVLGGAVCALASGHVVVADQRVAQRLTGVWSLVSCESVADGHVEYPYGKDALGQLAYDAAGHMSVQIMRPDRPLFASGDYLSATPAEVSAAFGGYVAYYGRYSVDESAGVVTHHLEGSWFPNMVGSDQRRYFVLDGDRLILTSPPILSQGSMRVFKLVWKRLQ